MDYFVNIENTPYNQWQAELLIESFKHHGLEENLVVGLAPVNAPSRFTRNLFSHARTHVYSNMGEVRGYDRMNRLYGMVNLLQQGMLRQPFVLLEPDSVLYKPLEISRQEIPHVVFQANPFFTVDMVKDHIPNLDKYLPKNGSWVPLGGVTYFDNIPSELFERALIMTEMLAYEQAREGLEIWKYTDRAAWAINIADLLGGSVLEGVYTMEMPLNDYRHKCNVISYEKGVQPHFAKSMFMYLPPSMLSMGDPFDVLSRLHETVATAPVEYISSLAGKYLDSQKNQG